MADCFCSLHRDGLHRDGHGHCCACCWGERGESERSVGGGGFGGLCARYGAALRVRFPRGDGWRAVVGGNRVREVVHVHNLGGQGTRSGGWCCKRAGFGDGLVERCSRWGMQCGVLSFLSDRSLPPLFNTPRDISSKHPSSPAIPWANAHQLAAQAATATCSPFSSCPGGFGRFSYTPKSASLAAYPSMGP